MIREFKPQYFTLEGAPRPIDYVGLQEVAPGVECEVYTFEGDDTKDLAMVHVEPNAKTPLQRVVGGIHTVEHFMSGTGELTIRKPDGATVVHKFRDGQEPRGIEVKIGQIMQWTAGDQGLVFAEVCEPPYQDGRFENLPE